jgi:hypothetical protein
MVTSTRRLAKPIADKCSLTTIDLDRGGFVTVWTSPSHRLGPPDVANDVSEHPVVGERQAGRGVYMITATPTRQITAPIRS